MNLLASGGLGPFQGFHKFYWSRQSEINSSYILALELRMNSKEIFFHLPGTDYPTRRSNGQCLTMFSHETCDESYYMMDIHLFSNKAFACPSSLLCQPRNFITDVLLLCYRSFCQCNDQQIGTKNCVDHRRSSNIWWSCDQLVCNRGTLSYIFIRDHIRYERASLVSY